MVLKLNSIIPLVHVLILLNTILAHHKIEKIISKSILTHHKYQSNQFQNHPMSSLQTANVTSLIEPIDGFDSELNINCISYSGSHYDFVCANMKIYTDYSTTVSLTTYATYGFYQTTIYQYSDITKSPISTDPNYINYRASVNLWASIYDRGFQEFIMYATDHGNFTIYSEGIYGFYGSIIHADHSFVTTQQYTISGMQ